MILTFSKCCHPFILLIQPEPASDRREAFPCKPPTLTRFAFGWHPKGHSRRQLSHARQRTAPLDPHPQAISPSSLSSLGDRAARRKSDHGLGCTRHDRRGGRRRRPRRAARL